MCIPRDTLAPALSCLPLCFSLPHLNTTAMRQPIHMGPCSHGLSPLTLGAKLNISFPWCVAGIYSLVFHVCTLCAYHPYTLCACSLSQLSASELLCLLCLEFVGFSRLSGKWALGIHTPLFTPSVSTLPDSATTIGTYAICCVWLVISVLLD